MPKYMFTDEEKTNIVEDYLNGVSFNDIYIKYGIKGNKPIYRILNEKNIALNRNPYILHYSEEMQDKFNETFSDSINKNYLIVDNSNVYQKYIFDINYFNAIDTQDKAYILGLIYADGNISQNMRTLSISLQEQDAYILNQIRDLLGIEKELRLITLHDKNQNWSNQYCLSISNKHFAESLIAHGVMPNKSLKIKFPTNLPMDLYRHFLRGYIDGDGSITKTPREKRIRFVSTEDFCMAAKLFIEVQLKINASIKNCKNNEISKEVMIAGGNQVKKFLDWIYEDAHLFLQRKYDRYLYLFYDNTISLSA